MAFRFLAANQAPDFRSVARFRRRHLEALAALFVQVLGLCREAGMVRLGPVAGRELRAVPDIPSSPTFIARAKHFDEPAFTAIEAANSQLVGRWFAALDAERRQALSGVRPTLDLDPTDVEVYGRQKEGVAYNHQGKLVGRPHPVVWAEAGVVVAAELGDGRTDPRPQAPGLVRRAVAALPEGLEAPIVRADSGFFDAKVARAAVTEGCDFAIVAKRSPATWAAARAVGDGAWRPATGMTGAEVAVCGYVLGGWPPGTRCVVRRVRIDAQDISTDGRSRRRRTIDPDQLALALDGKTGHASGYRPSTAPGCGPPCSPSTSPVGSNPQGDVDFGGGVMMRW